MGANNKSYANREAEQKVKYLETVLKENDQRIRDCEENLIKKEKELTEALNRLDAYESGDYQLQEAVGEIKSLKAKVKVRDRDIETLTKHLTKVDYVLNEALEENDDLRAKLGMEPKEKINLDELKDLKAMRAQENRAFVHVLKKEVGHLGASLISR
jgi:centrosomal protein CEP290